MKSTHAQHLFGLIRALSVCLLLLAAVSSPAISPVQVVRADSDPWTTTGTLTAVRGKHIAIRLLSGKVLLAGGVNGSGTAIRTIDLYDPAVGTWSTSGTWSMLGARFEFPAALLPDGRVLVVGGVRGTAAINETELYDPASGTWTAAAALPIASAYATATTLLNSGKVLVTGGANTGTAGLNNTYLYDPTTNSYPSAGTMNNLRRNHAATLLNSGNVLITGGAATDGSTALATIDLYDPVTGWAAAGGLNSMANARHSHTATLLADGRVLVAGGTANLTTAVAPTEIYDPNTGAWSSAGTMVTPRFSHEAVLLPDGKVVVVGGTDGDNVLSSAEIYDPTAGPTGTWSAVSYPMSTPRMFHTATLLLTNKVLVAGGSSTGSNVLNSAQLYDATEKTSQTITVTTHAPPNATYNTSFTVAATATSGLTVTYSASGGCTNLGATFTMTSGTSACNVQYDQSGDDTYNPAPRVTETVTAIKASQSITVTTPAPPSPVFGSKFTVAATAPGGAVVYSSGSTGVCTVSGAEFTMVSGTGDCIVQYNQGGNVNYAAAPQVTNTVTAAKLSQTITVSTHAPPSAAYGASFTVAATATSGLSVAITSGSLSVCTVTGSQFTMLVPSGDCLVLFDQAGNGNYSAASRVSETTHATKASQTITVTTHGPPSAAYNSHFTVAATAPGGAVVYSSGSESICTNVGSEFTMIAASGDCIVRYNQPGNANYDAAPQVTDTVPVGKANQTITVVTSPPSNAAYNSHFTVAATAPGGTVTFSSADTGICTNIGADFTMVSGTGTCVVQFDQGGNSEYNPAPRVTRSATATKINQTITVTTHAVTPSVYGTQFTVAATAPGGPVSYSSSNTSVCTNVGALFTMVSGTGSCNVQYDQVGNLNYNAATQVIEAVSAAKASQTINVTTGAPTSAVYNSNFTVAATAPGGPVTYSSGSSGICSVSGAQFTMLAGSGDCIVQYNQSGNTNYFAATQVNQTVHAAKASQTITFDPLGDKHVGDPDFPVSATASSSLPVSFSVGASDQCTITGSTVHLTGAGSCTVTANQGGNGNYLAASPISRTFAIVTTKLSQTITFAALPNKTYDDPDFTVSATASSGLPVSFSAGAGSQCTVTGNSVHITAAGSCTVVANQAGNDTYLPAGSVSRTFSIARCSAPIQVNGLSHIYDGSPKAVSVTTNPTGLNVIITYEGKDGTVYPASSTPPTDIGTYQVTVEIDDLDYQGTANATMTITNMNKIFFPIIVH